ncbi:MAG TPA: hypothetical protein VFZ09_33985 [Archangium sp.]|uniref:TRAFAC clade GTPase domain-containing protein n=1 Tax=Archangium sp. TaxID=1872627 RepID=UPI002E2FA2FD|nr:hypothetical protein [Archangium sp.]HEX5751284.1 hypothetical protein [Archangium sp.]
MSDQHRIALLGGPSTGKSTYLGALVDALQMEKLQHLRLAGLGDDAVGLQRLADPLLGGHYPQRTKVTERLSLDAPLHTAGTYFDPLSFTLRAGDYAGEEVERLFRDRIHGWSEEWKARAFSSGFLLLVRPDTLTRLPRPQPTSEQDERERWRLLRHEPVAEPSSVRSGPAPVAPTNAAAYFGPLPVEEVPPTPRAAPSDPVSVPTALSLIELLQFIRHVRGLAPGERPRAAQERFRIALVLTAWDTVDSSWRQAGPAAYLAHHLPLLEDYLWSNFLQEDVFRFGLSATGGDLNDASYSQRYLEDPSGFVEWWEAAHGPHRSADIGMPLYWLLFGDRALGAP